VKELLPNADEIQMLRQIECGCEPVVALSKFTQTTGCVVFEWLFRISHTIQQMSMSSFKMYEDISDKPGVLNLRPEANQSLCALTRCCSPLLVLSPMIRES
jgi:hypothetical protein